MKKIIILFFILVSFLFANEKIEKVFWCVALDNADNQMDFSVVYSTENDYLNMNTHIETKKVDKIPNSIELEEILFNNKGYFLKDTEYHSSVKLIKCMESSIEEILAYKKSLQ